MLDGNTTSCGPTTRSKYNLLIEKFGVKQSSKKKEKFLLKNQKQKLLIHQKLKQKLQQKPQIQLINQIFHNLLIIKQKVGI